MPKKKKTKRVPTKQEKLLAAGENDPAMDLIPVDKSTGVPKEDSENDSLEHEKLSEEIDTNLRIAIRPKIQWNETAKEDIDFALGNQWTTEERSTLDSQGRPVLTFNKIKPMIQLVTGHLIQNQARIQAFPEGGEDETFTSVMDKILDHIEKVSHLNFKLSYQFASGCRAGRSWIEFFLDYDEDPIFGQLKIPNLGPFKVYMDPSGVEYDLSDCQYGFKVVKLSKGRLKQLFPEKKDQIDDLEEDYMETIINESQQVDSGDESDYGNAKDIPRSGIVSETEDESLKGDLMMLTTVEYWKREYVDRWFVYFVADGSIEEFDTEDEAKSEVARRQKLEHERITKENVKEAMVMDQVSSQLSAMKIEPPEAPMPQLPGVESVKIDYAMRKRRVRRMKIAVKAGGLILTSGAQDSPFEPYYHDYPWFQFIEEWAPDADKEELRVQGLVRSLKDPQKEVNKSRSQYLHILNSSANSGWIGDEEALTPQKWDELRQFGSTPGIQIRKTKPGAMLERIQPVEPSLANQVREKAATDDFKEVSGINADLLSVDAKSSPSGKAIALRIRQAVTILQPAFQNFRYTKYLVGQFLFKIIPSMFDAAKIEKILGQQFMDNNQLNRGLLQSYLTMIEDGKFNVQISEAGAPDTLRAETFEDLMNLVQAGMQMPPDVLFEFMNVPNKQEVIRKVTEYQQQQMQMQQQSNAGKAPR